MKNGTLVSSVALIAAMALSSCSSGVSEDALEEPGLSDRKTSASSRISTETATNSAVSGFGDWKPEEGNRGDDSVTEFLSKFGTELRKTDSLPLPAVGGPVETFVSKDVLSDGAYVERFADGTSSVGFRDAWFSYGKDGRVIAHGKNWVRPAVEALSASGMTDGEKDAVREKFSSAYARTGGFRSVGPSEGNSPIGKDVAKVLAEEARRK